MARQLRKSFLTLLVIALMGALLAVSQTQAGPVQIPKAGPINQLSTQLQQVQETQLPNLLSLVQALQDRVAALEGQVAALQATLTNQAVQIGTLNNQIGTLNNNPVLALGPYVSVHPNPIMGLKGPHVIFTGANVHVRSGAGTTDEDFYFTRVLSGLGNLVVGYNRNEQNFLRTGSHNLVVGDDHGYTRFGGLVAGRANTISGYYASVSGGYQNTARGDLSSVTGGYHNTASHWCSSVTGSRDLTADVNYQNLP